MKMGKYGKKLLAFCATSQVEAGHGLFKGSIDCACMDLYSGLERPCNRPMYVRGGYRITLDTSIERCHRRMYEAREQQRT